jgi:uncharacterized protein (TIGR03437 family)
MPRCVIILFICFTLHAQFDNLVTTDDGSSFLFQSTWRLAGSNDTNLLKIFRWDAKGFSLVFSPPNPGLAQPPYETSPFLSGDGKISGYLVYAGCTGAACSSTKPTLALDGATVPASIPAFGPFQVSRNGRYLSSGTTVVDLTTGKATDVAPGDITGAGSLGNNGALLTQTLVAQFIVHSATLKLSSKPGVVIVTAPIILDAVLSAQENRVIYEIWSDGAATHDQLWSYDVSTGQSTKLIEIPLNSAVGFSRFLPSLSNDGSRLLFRRQRADGAWEAVVQDFSTGTTTVIAQILPNSNTLVITGDGKSAWVHRIDGKLVRVAIDTLQATEVPGRHAWVSQHEGAPVPGSYHHLYGGGFALEELTVDLQGVSLPLISADAAELDVQIPWQDLPSTQFPSFPMTIHSASSPFESVVQLDLETVAPTFERTGMPMDSQRDIVIAHQDFHGLVTSKDPAAPGEIVHAYMTGLGEVQPTPLTGTAPSPTLLSNTAIRPLCWVQGFPSPQKTASVMFAGLAPGLIGMYQMDIAIPVDISGAPVTLSCVDQLRQVIGDSGTIYVKGQSIPPSMQR